MIFAAINKKEPPFGKLFYVLQVFVGVYVAAILAGGANLKVQVRTGRVAGAADIGDGLAAVYILAAFYCDRGTVSVQGV